MSDRLYLETKFAIGDEGEIEAKAWDFTRPDRIGDVIEPKAFEGTALPIPMLFGHDQNDPIGVWTEATIHDNALHLKGRLLIEEVARAREFAPSSNPALSVVFLSDSSPARHRPARAAAQSSRSNCLRRRLS